MMSVQTSPKMPRTLNAIDAHKWSDAVEKPINSVILRVDEASLHIDEQNIKPQTWT